FQAEDGIRHFHVTGVQTCALPISFYGIISSHGAKDACRFHEGRIIKLTANAPGPYPTIEQLRATNQIWHPNCKHTFTTISDLDALPDDVRTRAEKQHERGEAAIRTGKRNPSDSDIATA